MPGIYIDSCDDRPYGPTQTDYEYDKWRDEMTPDEVNLHDTTDAVTWAREFNKTFAELHEGCTLDEGWLIGWFANAMMAADDAATKREKQKSFDSNMAAKKSGYDEGILNATKRTAQTCMELCDSGGFMSAYDCAQAIKKEFGL